MKITPRIEESKARKLIGVSCHMSILNNRTAELWSGFRPRVSEIFHRVSLDFISLQNYPEDYFRHFDPKKSFEKWAAVEVLEVSNIPKGMQFFELPAGKYAVFEYKGTSSDPHLFQYIYNEWLPTSRYRLDHRPHFEVLGEKYKNNDPNSEEQIWVPILDY
ncbi:MULTISPECIES: GyrI-like domain-containing protein [Maribacter]|uniref:GyrI-like domain-containing protein n=1 Tax=Maribacter flavus TaxID=1658664 RepID=A0ABU7IL62_9FLAO|nr:MULTISPECIES: GyrI-like domain-containing protein [Maribacter]MDC6406574.1 GyrI-like domain-containing protein [Maribacter sp. PR66]MEE1973692.1 GyrI-like domain-containing protein [Maribacter flavus]